MTGKSTQIQIIYYQLPNMLQIVTEPNQILRKKGRLVKSSDFANAKFNQFINALIDTMYACDAVGIAAPQVGQSIQICVIAKKFTKDKKMDLVLINPVWRKKATKRTWGEEGCLSVPNTIGKIQRYDKIMVEALDTRGNKTQFEADDFFARAIQHEVDHLNGILFIDKAKDIIRADNYIL